MGKFNGRESECVCVREVEVENGSGGREKHG